MMLRRIIATLILVPLAIAVVLFAVANRQVVTLSFDPFDATNPAFAFSLPLFMLFFILVGIGVLLGGVAAWVRQHRWRTRARRAEAEERRLRAELEGERLRASLPPPAEAVPPIVLPPAA